MYICLWIWEGDVWQLWANKKKFCLGLVGDTGGKGVLYYIAINVVDSDEDGGDANANNERVVNWSAAGLGVQLAGIK